MSNARILADLMGTSTTVPTAKLPTIPSSKLSLTAADMPTGSVLQVKQTVNSARTTVTSSTLTDFITVSITPTSTSSKILVEVKMYVGAQWWNNRTKFAIVRDSALITYNSGNLWPWQYGADSGNSPYEMCFNTANVLDSPSTTNAITYKAQLASQDGSKTVTMNGNYGHSTNYGQSSITVMEIAG